MRRFAFLAVALLAGLAAPAGAQDAGRIRVVSAPAPTLRSAEQPAPDAPAANPLAGLIPVPPPVSPVGSRVVADSRQCKRSCNRDYYFCLSADEETCAPNWTRCTASCG